MATATRETKTIEKIETVEEEVIQLTLTREEAITLKSLCLKVLSTHGTYSKHTREIMGALGDMGIFVWSQRFTGTLGAKSLPEGDE